MEKIKKTLSFYGAIGAIITSLVYMIIIITLVGGIKSKMQSDRVILISVLGAIAGLLITFMLRGQGVQLAKDEDNEGAQVMKRYYQAINKTKPMKKLRTIDNYILINTLVDIVLKGFTLAATTYFSITIFMEGSGDWSLIGLGIANILMFLSFGIIALSKTYTYYMEEHLPAIEEKIRKLGENNEPEVLNNPRTGDSKQ